MKRPHHLAVAFLVLVLPAAGQQTLRVTVTGQVSVLAPAPTSGPFAQAAIGDPITIAMTLELPGTQSPHFDGRTYRIVAPPSTVFIGAASTPFAPTGASLGVWNDYLGTRDEFIGFQEPLLPSGLLRIAAIDPTGTIFDTSDLTRLRGTYPASVFAVSSIGLQVGGGFIEGPLESVRVFSAGIGDLYCDPAVANSTSRPGILEVTGSEVVSMDQLRLTALQLPQNTFGFFLTSRVQGQVANPGGSQGVLCLGGAIGRYQAFALNSGTTGTIALDVSPLSLPQPLGTVSAQVGESWSFQGWYRDANPQPTSNFTDAVAVTFQ
jgi:hypothetical protein